MRRENDTAHQAVIAAARQRGIEEMALKIAVRDAATYGPVRPRPRREEGAGEPDLDDEQMRAVVEMQMQTEAWRDGGGDG